MIAMRAQTALILGSFLAHLWILLANSLFPEVTPWGDLSLYNYWIYLMQESDPWFGISQAWVYPALALLPMWLARVIAPQNFDIGWLLLIFIANTLVILKLNDFKFSFREKISYQKLVAPWFFLAGLVSLGPVALGRIDSFSVVFALLGVIALSKDKIVMAASWFTFGGWIKVWPIAMFVGLMASTKRHLLAFVAATSASALIFVLALALGGNQSILSFATQQQSRGIQIESVIATPWIWDTKVGGQSNIYFDDQMLTNQVQGPWTDWVSSNSNLIMFGALGITLILGLVMANRGVDWKRVFAFTSLAGTLDLIVFNKVGSPQFMLWLLVPVVAGLMFQIRNWNFAIYLVLAIELLTQFVYPVSYLGLLSLETSPVVILTLRNILLVVLLIWATSQLASKKFFEQGANLSVLNQKPIVAKVRLNHK
jgi:hypothetical protein